jgi:transcriptional regulator with XRE-family HTH domain
MTLRERLEAHGISTIAALSKATGLSRQQAWELWHGRASLGLRVAKRIAEGTGVPLAELIDVDEAIPGTPKGQHPPE